MIDHKIGTVGHALRMSWLGASEQEKDRLEAQFLEPGYVSELGEPMFEGKRLR